MKLAKVVTIIHDVLNVQMAAYEIKEVAKNEDSGLEEVTQVVTVSRAVKTLQSDLLMNLDPRGASYEDYGTLYSRNVLNRNSYSCPIVIAINRALSSFKYEISNDIEWSTFCENVYDAVVIRDSLMLEDSSLQPKPISKEVAIKSDWVIFCMCLYLAPVIKKINTKTLTGEVQ